MFSRIVFFCSLMKLLLSFIHVAFSGLSLTAADAGNNNIRVAGVPQLKSFLHTTRHFMKLPDGLLNFHTSTEQSSCVFNSSEIDLRMISFDCRNANGSSQRNCFVGRTPELKGKFDLLKAQALKVPKGPLFGKKCLFLCLGS